MFSAAFLLCSVTFAGAQNTSKADYPKVEVFIGYALLGENPRPFTFGLANATGFETSVVRNFARHIGLVGDFSAHFHNETGRGLIAGCTTTCGTAVQDFQIKGRVYNFLAGPEFKARNRTRFTPFAHVLAGVAHTSNNFTSLGPPYNIVLKTSHNGFAMGVGGGLDIRATNRVSFRAQMDYNPVFTNEPGAGRRDLARISFGVLLH